MPISAPNFENNPATVAPSNMAALVAVNTNYVRTYNPANSSEGVILTGFWWSYSGGTPAGNLIITDGTLTPMNVDITNAGPGFVAFGRSVRFTSGATVTMTLAAGGAGVLGKCGDLANWSG